MSFLLGNILNRTVAFPEMMRKSHSIYWILMCFTLVSCFEESNNDSHKTNLDSSNSQKSESDHLSQLSSEKLIQILKTTSLDPIEFKSSQLAEPKMLEGFYSEEELKRFYFIDILSEFETLRIAVSKSPDNLGHSIYFLRKVKGYWYISFSELLKADLSFMSDSLKHLKVFKSNDSIKPFYLEAISIIDIKGRWKLSSSILLEENMKVNREEFLEIINEDYMIFNSVKVKYFVKGNIVYNYSDSTSLFDLVSFGVNNILVRLIIGDSTQIAHFERVVY